MKTMVLLGVFSLSYLTKEKYSKSEGIISNALLSVRRWGIIDYRIEHLVRPHNVPL